MSIKKTGRAVKLNNDIEATDQNWDRLLSQFKAASDLTVQYTAWLHDNLINAKGDVDEDDRLSFRAAFEEKMAQFDAEMQKLHDCYAVYAADPATYQQNVTDFIAKYGLDITEFDKRFS